MRWVAFFVIAGMLTVATAAYASEGILSPLSDAPPSQFLPSYTVTVTEEPYDAHGEPALLLAISRYYSQQEVLSAQTEATPAAVPQPQPSETPTVRTARKDKFTVTLVGDSMIDTLGPDAGGLADLLRKAYPSVTFTVINHGVGAENIDSGLRRLENGYSYLGVPRDSVLSAKPDIVVIESFGYNPYPITNRDEALTKHWLALSQMTDTVKNNMPGAKVVIAATIAPNWDTFGDGAPFISMSPEGKRQKAEEIRQYIESTIGFAASQKLPLADAYHPSLGPDKNGNLAYINAGDHIHYSPAGRTLMANAVARAIISAKLLE